MIKNSKFRNNLIVIVFLCIGTLIYNLIICNKDIKVVSSEELSNINIQEYFPEPGTSLEYVSGRENPGVIEKHIVRYYGSSLFNSSENKNKFIVYKSNNIGREQTCLYEVNENNIKLLKTESSMPLGGDKQEIILKKVPKWDEGEDIKKYITGININVNTEAGCFNECIEVTKEELNGDKNFYTKEYYAPKLGLILTKYSEKGSIKCENVYLELAKYFGGTNSRVEQKNSDKSNNESNIINSNSNLYKNKTYKFTLTIPNSWNGKYSVKEGSWTEEAERTIDFFFVVNGKNYGNIFSVIVLKSGYDKEYVENAMWHYIDTVNGKVYAYSVAEQPVEELLKEEHKKELDILKDMINNDVPSIIKSLKVLD